MGKTLKIFGFTIYFLLLAGVFAKLFFETEFDKVISLFTTPVVKAETLTIGFSEPLIRLDPLANDSGSKMRLLHIYEPLVGMSPDLQIKPSLAISFGAIDDLTWEFRLRPGVFFHDGNPLTIADVLFSLLQAKRNPNSGVKDLASTIQEVNKMDDSVFRIKTISPDPLLLQKLSSILIFPQKSGEVGVGTGPYRLLTNEDENLTMVRFDKYWDTSPYFHKVILKTFASKDEKIKALEQHTVDVVANVPTDLADEFDYRGFELKNLPTLEVNFLMFHFDKVFQDRRLREAVALALRVSDLARLTSGFAEPAAQFVGNGVFGYDPSIAPRESDATRAFDLLKEATDGHRVSVTLDLPKGLEVFGMAVKKQLARIGMDVQVVSQNPVQLGEKISRHESEFYFFGWKTDLGDALDFLTAVAHSPSKNYGQFNGGNYHNPTVDELIETAQSTLKPSVRLELMRKAMKIITQEDVIGIPLFSPEVLYGVSTNLKWEPRVDGLILAQEVKM